MSSQLRSKYDQLWLKYTTAVDAIKQIVSVGVNSLELSSELKAALQKELASIDSESPNYARMQDFQTPGPAVDRNDEGNATAAYICLVVSSCQISRKAKCLFLLLPEQLDVDVDMFDDDAVIHGPSWKVFAFKEATSKERSDPLALHVHTIHGIQHAFCS